MVEKCIRKSRFGPPKRPNFSPRPNHGGPRGVQSQGPGAHGGPSQKARKNVINSKEVKSGYAGAPGAFRLWTPFSGIQRGDDNPWSAPTFPVPRAAGESGADFHWEGAFRPVEGDDGAVAVRRRHGQAVYEARDATPAASLIAKRHGGCPRQTAVRRMCGGTTCEARMCEHGASM